MLNGGIILNYIKTAMMICKHKSFGRNHFSCTKTSKADNCILQAPAVNIIYILCTYLHAKAFHLFFIQPFQQLRQPHPFISKRCYRGQKDKKKEIYRSFYTLHMANFWNCKIMDKFPA